VPNPVVYFFIENKDQIADFFADCLGGLLSVVAQNLVMTLKPVEGVKILAVKTAFKVATGENGSWTVNVGDLQSEEFRDVLIETSVPALEHAPSNLSQPVVNITLSYFNVITSKQEEVSLAGTILRSNPEDVSVPDVYVDQQKNRFVAADALTLAKEHGDKKQYEEGRQLLDTAITVLSTSVSKDVEYVKELVIDLQKAKEGLKDQTSFSTYGGHTMTSYAVSHYQQRSCGTTRGYSTASRATMKSNLDEEEDT